MFQVSVQQNLVTREAHFEIIKSYLKAADDEEILNFLNFVALEAHLTFLNVIRFGPSRQLMLVQPNETIHEYASLLL